MYIRHFISARLVEEQRIELKNLVRELKHIGTSVMDVYTGKLPVPKICREVRDFLESEKVFNSEDYSTWTGHGFSDYKLITLSDNSVWMLKYHNDEKRYVHFFPSRQSPHTFRVKANTLKSAILYHIIIGKDFISRKDLNYARSLLDLSPVKDPAEAAAITEMIEVLRAE